MPADRKKWARHNLFDAMPGLRNTLRNDFADRTALEIYARERLLDVQRYRIYQMDAIAALGEPDGISARAAAHIGDHRRRRRQIPRRC